MFHLDTLSTLVAATLVLLLGRKLVQTVPLLKKYTIPEPVAGGLLVALALLVLKKSMDIDIDFDMSLKDPLMLAFFATIGLNANLASLRAGGKVLGTFLICWPGRLPYPAATAPGRRGVSCSLSATVLPTPPRWRWPARLSAWCSAA